MLNIFSSLLALWIRAPISSKFLECQFLLGEQPFQPFSEVLISIVTSHLSFPNYHSTCLFTTVPTRLQSKDLQTEILLASEEQTLKKSYTPRIQKITSFTRHLLSLHNTYLPWLLGSIRWSGNEKKTDELKSNLFPVTVEILNHNDKSTLNFLCYEQYALQMPEIFHLVVGYFNFTVT